MLLHAEQAQKSKKRLRPGPSDAFNDTLLKACIKGFHQELSVTGFYERFSLPAKRNKRWRG